MAFGIMREDTPHPLSKDLRSADVISMHFQAASDDQESYLDLVVFSNGIGHGFRFFSPQQLRLGEAFPHISYLQILDVEHRRLDRLKVLVLDGEQSESIRFYASAVEVLPA
jgi:hypothetical protein